MTETDETLRLFLLATKPDWCIPTDVAICAAIIVSGDTYPGHDEIAARCGIRDSKGILRSLRRMEAAGWLFRYGGAHPYKFRAVPSKLPRAEEAQAAKNGGE